MTMLALLLLLAFRSSRYGLFLYLLKIVQMLRDYYHIAKCALCPLHTYIKKKTNMRLYHDPSRFAYVTTSIDPVNVRRTQSFEFQSIFQVLARRYYKAA